LSHLAPDFLIAIALDLIVIPWTYVFAQYVRKTGDQWRHCESSGIETGSMRMACDKPKPPHQAELTGMPRRLANGAIAIV
jgi:hypothetical protein